VDAQEALTEAERAWRVQQQGNRASDTSVKAAKAAVVVARESMEIAERRYKGTSGEVDEDLGKAQAYQDYAAAVSHYQQALINYNWYTGKPTEAQQAELDAALALAQATLAQARRDLESVDDGPNATELAQALCP